MYPHLQGIAYANRPPSFQLVKSRELRAMSLRQIPGGSVPCSRGRRRDKKEEILLAASAPPEAKANFGV